MPSSCSSSSDSGSMNTPEEDSEVPGKGRSDCCCNSGSVETCCCNSGSVETCGDDSEVPGKE